jgi:enoyl-CoA hydratase/carnithine racemase
MHIDTLPDVCFTVLTGEGRFFSSGADLVAGGLADRQTPSDNEIERKRVEIARYMWYADLLRRLINVG